MQRAAGLRRRSRIGRETDGPGRGNPNGFLTGRASGSRRSGEISRRSASRLRALLVRFDRELAAFCADGNAVEPVHQIRVISRRASAAAWALREALGGKERRGLLRALRRIRRRAGPTRDADVAIEEARRSGRAVEDLVRARAGHARRLARSVCGVRLAGLAPVATGGRGAPRFVDEARTALARALHRVRRRRNARSLKQVHALRRRLRRWRFTLEFFLPAFAGRVRRGRARPDPERVLERIKEQLDHFGRVSDAAVICETAKGARRRRVAAAARRALLNRAVQEWRRACADGLLEGAAALAGDGGERV
ncbi:MAG: CHAD domain-containing protein [Phycisphaerales bacterium]